MHLFDKILEELPHKRLDLKRGAYLVMEGQTDQNIYFVVEGAFCMTWSTAEEEHVIRLGYKGSMMAALASFMTGKPSVLSIKALRKSTVLKITKADFNIFLSKSEENMQLYVRLLEDSVTQQLEREMDILTESPTERYQRVLARSPHIFQEIPAKYIASYLRMTPETLSRIRNQKP